MLYEIRDKHHVILVISKITNESKKQNEFLFCFEPFTYGSYVNRAINTENKLAVARGMHGVWAK